MPATPIKPDAPTAIEYPARHRPSLRVPSIAEAKDSIEPCAELATSNQIAKRRLQARTAATKSFVLSRARGKCEACNAKAPFLGLDGVPFLELHHVRKKTDGGPGDPRYVVALCPNCHRRAHYSIDRDLFNSELKQSLEEVARLNDLKVNAV